MIYLFPLQQYDIACGIETRFIKKLYCDHFAIAPLRHRMGHSNGIGTPWPWPSCPTSPSKWYRKRSTTQLLLRHVLVLDCHLHQNFSGSMASAYQKHPDMAYKVEHCVWRLPATAVRIPRRESPRSIRLDCITWCGFTTSIRRARQLEELLFSSLFSIDTRFALYTSRSFSTPVTLDDGPPPTITWRSVSIGLSPGYLHGCKSLFVFRPISFNWSTSQRYNSINL